MNTRTLLALSLLGLASGCVRPPSPTAINIVYCLHGDLMSPALGEVFQHTNVLSRYGVTGQVTPLMAGRGYLETVRQRQTDVSLDGAYASILLLAGGYRGKVLASAGTSGRIGLVRQLGAAVANRVLVVDGSAGDVLLSLWEADKSLSPIQRVPTDARHLLTGLGTGQADGAVCADPDVESLTEHVGVLDRQMRQSQMILASDAFLQRDREGAERLVAAATDALFFVAAHRSTVAGWMATDLGDDAAAVERALATNHNVAAHSIVDIQLEPAPELLDAAQAVANTLHQYRLTPNPIHLAEFVDTDPVLRSHARFKGYYDPQAVQVVTP